MKYKINNNVPRPGFTCRLSLYSAALLSEPRIWPARGQPKQEFFVARRTSRCVRIDQSRMPMK
eukprot:scaffold139083_cov19-Prasinocladus_malaysianus.AAC.1